MSGEEPSAAPVDYAGIELHSLNERDDSASAKPPVRGPRARSLARPRPARACSRSSPARASRSSPSCARPVAAATARAAARARTQQVFVFRHCVRAPSGSVKHGGAPNYTAFEDYGAVAYPTWPVPPDWCTPDGLRAIAGSGAQLRELGGDRSGVSVFADAVDRTCTRRRSRSLSLGPRPRRRPARPARRRRRRALRRDGRRRGGRARRAALRGRRGDRGGRRGDDRAAAREPRAARAARARRARARRRGSGAGPRPRSPT